MQYTESALVEAIKAKDVNAYEYMIDTYSKILYFLAYNILNQSMTKEDMEECISDVFLDAWVNIEDFNSNRSNFKNWLLMLTKYKALGYKRKSKKTKLVDIDNYAISDDYSLEEHVLNKENQAILLKAINNFNITDKRLFIRRYFLGESINDLTKVLNLSRSAIDNRLFRGRKVLKEVLNENK